LYIGDLRVGLTSFSDDVTSAAYINQATDISDSKPSIIAINSFSILMTPYPKAAIHQIIMLV